MSLKTLRRSRGWSQADLAQICDLSERTIQRIESGRTASLEAVKALAASFDMTAEEIQAHLATRARSEPPGRQSSWQAWLWHALAFSTYASLVTALVHRFDSDMRIAVGVGLLGLGALLVHLAFNLHRQERRAQPTL